MTGIDSPEGPVAPLSSLVGVGLGNGLRIRVLRATWEGGDVGRGSR